jgi:hypothetical protein
MVVAVVLAGLIGSFLLPWQRFTAAEGFTVLGIENPPAVLAAVTSCLAATWWAAEARAGERLGLAAAAALFTGAAVSSITPGAAHAYGAWIGLGIALGLVGLSLLGAVPVSRPTRLPRHALATTAAVALLLAALFLPWQRACYRSDGGFGRSLGPCVSTNGWVTITGSVAAVLAILLLVATLAPRLEVSVVEIAIATALLVATFGFQLAATAGSRFAYGSIVGFSATALLLVLGLVPLRRPGFERHRLLVRSAPMTACLAYLVIVVVPWWDVLPGRCQSQALGGGFSPSWLTVAGAVLGLHLLASWARRITAASERGDRLALLPLAMLALATVDLMRVRDSGITWGGGIVVALCLVLALLGRIEEREGLEKGLRVPDLLRVDRL